MNHWIIVPVLLPALIAPLIGFVMRHDLSLARVTSVVGAVGVLAVSLGLVVLAAGGETHVYRLGNWPAPFGIVLVLDRLSALMLLLTAVLALVVLLHVIATGWDARGRHFHALYQFQLMGITGAFLTGDAFNLFVFFEILLIASYGLMIHGGGRVRVKAGLQYVVMNLAGSTLFLFALATIYATTGTLNIADLALKVREIAPEDAALIRVAGVLLLLVFAVKAALVPVQFWLPATYSNAPAPVAALFAIMTKVGAYSIIRIHTIAFGPDMPAMGTLIADWMMPAAIVTLAIGALGVLGARRLMPLLSFAVIGSMGTLMMAVAVFTPEAVLASLYYLVHSTLAAALLFLLADLVVSRRPGGDWLIPEAPVVSNGLLAALFFAGAIAMAGMPPLSGFLGKLLVLDVLRDGAVMPWAWTAILAGSLLIILGFVRAGSTIFWKSTAMQPALAGAGGPAGGDMNVDPATPEARAPGAMELAPSFVLLALLAALTLAAGPIAQYLEATAAQIFAFDGYIRAVLPEVMLDPGLIDAAPDAAPDATADTGPDADSPAEEE